MPSQAIMPCHRKTVKHKIKYKNILTGYTVYHYVLCMCIIYDVKLDGSNAFGNERPGRDGLKDSKYI